MITSSIASLAIIAVASYSKPMYESLAPYIILGSILILGIPHGALDLHVHHQLSILKSPSNASNILTGLLNYLLIMFGWSLGCVLFPEFTFWMFMAISCYHFGENDLSYIFKSHPSFAFKDILYISRGIFIVGITMTMQPQISYPIITKLCYTDHRIFFTASRSAFPVIVAQHFIILAISMISVGINRPNTLRFWSAELLKSALHVAVFVTCGSLMGFSIYFGFWHSLQSIVESINFFKEQKSIDWIRHGSMNSLTSDLALFYKLAAPYTLGGNTWY